MAEFKADIDILVECVKCQQNNPSALRQSLMTLSTLVSTDEAKDYFRESGGLKYVYNLLLKTHTTDIRVATLFCLASSIEKNVFSQKMLTHQSVFCISHDILQNPKTSQKLQQATVYFLLCVVANNGQAQNLARETGCLADLMDVFRHLLKNDNIGSDDKIGPFGLVTSALSMCVNNPQNEENQRLCSTLLPHIFSVVGRVSNTQILSSVMSLTGLMVASNVFNQDRVRKCGGLDVLISRFLHLIERGKEEEDCLTTAVQVVSTLDSCFTDNECNIRLFRDACGTGPLFILLTPGLLSQQEQLQVVIALSHVIISGGDSLLSPDDYQKLVCLLTQSDDEELIRALKYVLHMCKNPSDDHKKSQSSTNGESNLKQSSHLILTRIDELAAKLDMYQEESRQDPSSLNQNNSCSAPLANNLIDKLADVKVESGQDQSNRGLMDYRLDRNPTQFTGKTSPLIQDESSMEDQQASSQLMTWFKQFLPFFVGTGHVGPPKSNPQVMHNTAEGYQPLQFDKPDMAYSDCSLPDNFELNSGQQRMSYSLAPPYEQKVPVYDRLSSPRSELQMRLNADHHQERRQNLLNGLGRDHTLYRTHPFTDQLNTCGYPNLQRQVVSPYRNGYPDYDLQARRASLNEQHKSVFDYKHGHVEERIDSDGTLNSASSQIQNTRQNKCDGCCRRLDNERSSDVEQGNCHHTSEINCNPQCTCTSLERDRPEVFQDVQNVHRNFNTNNVNMVNSEKCQKRQKNQIRSEMSKPCSNCVPNVRDQVCNKCGHKSLEATRDKSMSEPDETSEVFLFAKDTNCLSHGKKAGGHLSKGNLMDAEKDACSISSHDYDSPSEPESSVPDDGISDSVQRSKSSAGHKKHKKTEATTQTRCTRTDEAVNKKHFNTSSYEFPSPGRKARKTPLRSRISPTGQRGNSIHSSCRSSKKSTRPISTPDSIKSTSSVFKTPAPRIVASQFLRPTDVPPRRNVRTPSTCGSSASSIGSRHNVRVLARKPVVGIQPYATSDTYIARCPTTPNLLISPRVTPLPSPTHSEFDMSLLKSARTNKAKEASQVIGSFTPSVKRVNLNAQRCWTDVRPTVCPSPVYSKALSLVNWSELSDTDSESVYTHSDDSSCSPEKNKDEDVAAAEDVQMNTSVSHPDLCPGCNPPSELHRSTLNSRTYNIALETTTGTCSKHRKMRYVERDFIMRQKSHPGILKKTRPLPALSKRNPLHSCPPTRGLSVYDFHPSSDDSELDKRCVSPPRVSDYQSNTPDIAIRVVAMKHAKKRHRVAYSEKEVRNLFQGVEKFGTKWSQMLLTYQFHSSRTAVDLMKKHQRLLKKDQEPKKRKKHGRPFSMCEERRLRRGVKTLGYNWKGILQMFRFARGRTADELRNKWRTMMKKVEH